MRKKIFVLLAVILAAFSFTGVTARADTFTNEDTGYKVIIEDEADLLTDNEEALLKSDMWLITKYGNAAFNKQFDAYSERYAI